MCIMLENTFLNSAFISAIISTVISVIATGLLYFFGIKNNRKEKLENDRNNILKISVEYPYLEYPLFCNSWDKRKANSNNSKSEKYIRYEMYTILVFNHLEDVCKYYKYDIDKISKKHVDIKNWLRLHKKIWTNPLSGEYENVDGYEDKFVLFVNNIINQEVLK